MKKNYTQKNENNDIDKCILIDEIISFLFLLFLSFRNKRPLNLSKKKLRMENKKSTLSLSFSLSLFFILLPSTPLCPPSPHRQLPSKKFAEIYANEAIKNDDFEMAASVLTRAVTVCSLFLSFFLSFFFLP